MESMLKGEPKEITAPLPKTGERHIRYLEDMTPEQREETREEREIDVKKRCDQ